MAFAFNNTDKRFTHRASTTEPERYPGFLLASKHGNQAAFADMQALVAAGKPPKYWKQSGAGTEGDPFRVAEMTALEKAAVDAAEQTARDAVLAARAAAGNALDAIRAKAPATRSDSEKLLVALAVLGKL